MGEQTRYIEGRARRIEQAAAVAVTRPVPIGPTETELDLSHNHVIEAEKPIPIRAFVRFHEAVIQPEGEAVAWTVRAVKICFTMQNDARHEVWAWASAVDRLEV